MPSSEFSRAAIASFFTIWLTRKCLPMSRRKSSADIPAVQSRLSTKTAGLSPDDPEEGLDLGADVRHPLGGLLLGLQHPLGRGPGVADEAGRPADEADDAVARPLEVAQQDELDEVPEVERGAVGSNPQYAVIGPSASARRSADSSVVCATSPRHCSSSRMSVTSVLPSSGAGASPAAPSLPRAGPTPSTRSVGAAAGWPVLSAGRRRGRRRCSRRPSRARRARSRAPRAAHGACRTSP